MPSLLVIALLITGFAEVVAQNTTSPSSSPSLLPSISPTVANISSPTSTPTFNYSNFPTAIPSVLSTAPPTSNNTNIALSTSVPSISPTDVSSTTPSLLPTLQPTSASPSQAPSLHPTVSPTAAPTLLSSVDPSASPSLLPSQVPSAFPSSPPFSTVSSQCAVDQEDWLGNGLCDFIGGYNSEACDYDGGDCCQSTRTTVLDEYAYFPDSGGSPSFGFCTDPSLLRRATFEFTMGNLSVGATRDPTLLHELVSETMSEVLNVSDTLLSVTATFSAAYGLLTADLRLSYEAPLVSSSSVVAGLTSGQLLAVLLNVTQSGELERAMRVEAVFQDMPSYEWVKVCLTALDCPTNQQLSPAAACSFQGGDWDHFYGWSHSAFPKYLLWLMALFVLKLGFTLHTAASYWAEKRFLSSARGTQYLLSVAIGLTSVVYLLVEMLVPSLHESGPKSFSCIEFSFREAGPDYVNACASDSHFANPFLVSSQLMVFSLICIAVNCRLQQFEDRYPAVSAQRVPAHSCGLALMLLHHWTRVTSLLLLCFLAALVVMLFVYLGDSTVPVYSALPLSTMAVTSQVFTGCHLLVAVVYSLWMTGTAELMQAVLNSGDEYACRRAECSAPPPVDEDSLSDLSSNERNFEERQNEEKQSDCEAQLQQEQGEAAVEDEVGIEAEPTEVEHESEVQCGEEPVAKANTGRLPVPEGLLVQVSVLLYAVLLISTAVVDLKTNFWFAALGYSLLLRACEVAVVFLVSKGL